MGRSDNRELYVKRLALPSQLQLLWIAYLYGYFLMDYDKAKPPGTGKAG